MIQKKNSKFIGGTDPTSENLKLYVCSPLVIIRCLGHLSILIILIIKIGNGCRCSGHTPGGGHIASTSNVKSFRAHKAGDSPAL